MSEECFLRRAEHETKRGGAAMSVDSATQQALCPVKGKKQNKGVCSVPKYNPSVVIWISNISLRSPTWTLNSPHDKCCFNGLWNFWSMRFSEEHRPLPSGFWRVYLAILFQASFLFPSLLTILHVFSTVMDFRPSKTMSQNSLPSWGCFHYMSSHGDKKGGGHAFLSSTWLATVVTPRHQRTSESRFFNLWK